MHEVEAEGCEALQARDWTTFNQNTATDDELRAIERPIAEYFARHTMQELYDIACETNLMLAPASSPREIYASAQLAARDFFDPVTHAPRSFVHVRTGTSARPRPRAVPDDEPRRDGTGAWTSVRILELGSGAAGPIATRYFVEHGATVLRIESKARPDFLRVYGTEGEVRVGWRESAWRRYGEDWDVFGSGYAKFPAMGGALDAFCRAVRGVAPLAVTTDDAVAAAAAVDAAYASLTTGGWVKLSQLDG